MTYWLGWLGLVWLEDLVRQGLHLSIQNDCPLRMSNSSKCIHGQYCGKRHISASRMLDDGHVSIATLHDVHSIQQKVMFEVLAILKVGSQYNDFIAL